MADQANFLLAEDMKLLESKGRIVTYNRGDIILNEHAENTKIFWVRKGEVRVEFDSLLPGVTLATIGPGDMFGEISYLTNSRATATVTAIDKVEVLEVDRDPMESILASNPALAARFYHTTSITLINRLRI